jgi:hypothetical protein
MLIGKGGQPCAKACRKKHSFHTRKNAAIAVTVQVYYPPLRASYLATDPYV